MATTSALSQEQQVALQTIYDEFKPTAVWPVFQHLDTVLDQEHDLHAEATLATLWPEFVSLHTPLRPDTTIALRVAGLAHCDGSEDDLGLFARMLRWTAEKERSFRPSSPSQAEQQVVTSEEAAYDLAASGTRISDLELRKAFALLSIEHVHDGSSSTDSSWTLTLSSRLRRFRGVRNYMDYLRVVETEQAAEPAANPMVTGGPIVVVQPPQRVQVVGGAEEEGDDALSLTIEALHPLVRDAIEPLFASGHYRQGVLEAALAMRDLVRTKSSLAGLSDQSLMGKALTAEDSRIVVADLSTSTGRSVQQGTMFLAQGVIARLRNPLSHEKVELDPQEAMEMAALISRVVRDVDAGDTAE
jgi:uncharacterized protein (TIGR02391 family)